MDFTTIIFLLLAGFVAWRLYSVLGMRTGHERDLTSAFRPGTAAPDNIVPLPNRADVPVQQDVAADPDRWKGFAEPQTPLADTLDAIAQREGGFDLRDFLNGAKSAYEMIVTAFAAGDTKTLKTLLSKDVFDGFASAIAEREKRGEKVSTTFVSIDKADLADAHLRDNTTQITVRFASKLITATTDAAGTVIDGAPDKVVDITDVWTFARESGSRDPNWKLIATEAGQ